METQLKFPAMLPLHRMALRRMAAHLTSGSDIVASILEVRSHFAVFKWRLRGEKQWQDVEDEVRDKMQQLVLPESFKKEVIHSVRLLALQIRRWENCYSFYFRKDEMSSLSVASKLFFTPAGVISHRKTAERLVHCDALSVEQRYRLACVNCLEDDIPLLWEKLPEESKHKFLNRGHSDLEYCWPRIIRGELCELDHLLSQWNRNMTSFNQWAFEYAAWRGNKAATEYFLPKLTEREKEESLMRTVESLLERDCTPTASFGHNSSEYIFEEVPEVCCYLMSLLSPEQQAELVRARPVHVLLFLLDLPWTDLFSENAALVWSLIPPSHFADLLMRMFFRYRNSDRHFPEIFDQFYGHSPPDFRKFFISHVSLSGMTPAIRFLSLFFEREDTESAEVLFRSVEDPPARVEIVFDKKVLSLISEVFLADRGWQMANVCLRAAELSDEDTKRWKETLVRFFGRNGDSCSFSSRRVKRGFDRLFRPARKARTGQKRKLPMQGKRTAQKKPREMSSRDISRKYIGLTRPCFVLLCDFSRQTRL